MTQLLEYEDKLKSADKTNDIIPDNSIAPHSKDELLKQVKELYVFNEQEE